jgi:hypothetical protein
MEGISAFLDPPDLKILCKGADVSFPKNHGFIQDTKENSKILCEIFVCLNIW